MPRVHAEAEKLVQGDAAAVYDVLADYATHHPRIMPPAHFSNLEVESGGVGEGTVFHITARVAGKEQQLHMRVSEPEPGRVLTETNLDTGVVTEFRITQNGGDATLVRMSSGWEGKGIRGWVDRIVAPRVMRGLFSDQLDQLDRYMRSKEGRES